MDNYSIELAKGLNKLPDKAKLLFAVLTCDHLYPNYVQFHEETGWGDPAVVREAIDTIYQLLINDNLYSTEDIQVLIQSVDLMTPDSTDFPETTSSYAAYACSAVIDTLRFVITPNSESILDVANYARDTVEMYLQIRDSFFNSLYDIHTNDPNDPILLREKQRQFVIVKTLLLIDINMVTDALIQSLRYNVPIIGIDVL